MVDGKDDDDMDAVLNTNPDDAGKRKKGKSAENKSLITRNLRMIYGKVTEEPMPDRFLEILNRIEDGEGKKS